MGASLGNDPGARIRAVYGKLSGAPGGKRIFSRLIGWMAPYTGTTRARVLELDRGFARIEMRDRRRVRNHLRSIHAVALVNLAEETTGLALMFGLPQGARGILTGLSMDYLKKARGTLTATARCAIPETTERREYEVEGEVRDAQGDLVARARARWLIGPSAT
ncbi:MAG: hotdog fold domain-containing protein [Acidobacteriota bacterium]